MVRYRYKIHGKGYSYYSTSDRTPAQMASWKAAYNRHNKKNKVGEIVRVNTVKRRAARRTSYGFGGFPRFRGF